MFIKLQKRFPPTMCRGNFYHISNSEDMLMGNLLGKPVGMLLGTLDLHLVGTHI